VTTWIGQLQAGDEAALTKLHGRYWPWLVDMARRKLKGTVLAAADEEDVAQQAFASFCRRFKSGGVPRLVNRHDLLALLTTIVARKAVNQIDHDLGTQRRGAGRVKSESSLAKPSDDDEARGVLDQLADRNPTPQEEALLHDSYLHYLEGLPEKLRPFAELFLAGFTCREMAQKMDCAKRTAERKVELILSRWQEMAADSVSQG
jgi:DNA-directed RNA polymerase specialized sigma24 family protein